MDQQFISRLERAQALVRSVSNAAMASVNDDGSPHNTPLFIAFSPDFLMVYWSSNPVSQHSQNVARQSQAYFVLYDATAGGGLYFPVHNIQIADGDSLARGLTAYNRARVLNGKQQPLLLPAFSQPNVQRLYCATVTSYSVNLSERDESGKIVRDYRRTISAHHLNTPAEDATIN